jgi:UDP-N-acetylmuramoyl-tripeptide--D-alanyl-D-alanine ligase
MRPRTLGEIAAAVGGAVRGGADTTIGGVATDSRAVRPDSLFVALVGERLDGHDFIADALGAEPRPSWCGRGSPSSARRARP